MPSSPSLLPHQELDQNWNSPLGKAAWNEGDLDITQEPPRTRDDGWDRFVFRCVNALHFLDGIFALIILGYASVVAWSAGDGDVPRGMEIVMFWVAAILLLRSLLGYVATRSESYTLRALQFSSIVGWILKISLIVVTLIVIIKPSKINNYFDLHRHSLHIPEAFVSFLEHHSRSIWITLLSWLAFEVLRSFIVYQYRTLVLDEDDHDRLQLRGPWTDPGVNTTQQESSDLEDPLLGWTGRHEQSSAAAAGATPPASMFSRLFQSTTVNARDDGSVDFASVQEDWASRTEEDPFWWSREGNRRG